MTNKTEIIKIDKYEPRLVKGEIHYYAISGKKEYEMPTAHASMYDEHHLAIEKISSGEIRSEVLNEPSETYIPLRTD